jgi:hypothetical protein
MTAATDTRRIELARNHLARAQKERGATKRYELWVAALHLLKQLEGEAASRIPGSVRFYQVDHPRIDAVLPLLQQLLRSIEMGVSEDKCCVLELLVAGEKESWIACPKARLMELLPLLGTVPA